MNCLLSLRFETFAYFHTQDCVSCLDSHQGLCALLIPKLRFGDAKFSIHFYS